MTRKEIIEMFEMRMDGETLENIGKKFGLTRERVRQLLTPSQRAPKEFECIYAGLKKWMIENGYSCPRFVKHCGLRISMTTFYARITGRKDFHISDIKCILAFTGMTFDEAFGVAEKPDGTDPNEE